MTPKGNASSGHVGKCFPTVYSQPAIDSEIQPTFTVLPATVFDKDTYESR